MAALDKMPVEVMPENPQESMEENAPVEEEIQATVHRTGIPFF